MRIKVLAFATSLFLITNSSAAIPQTTSATASSVQATTLLAQAAKALTGSAVVNDVTLTGTAEWIAGSDDETGTATYRGLAGAYRLDLTFRSGTRSQFVSPVNGLPAGNWIGFDGVSHSIADHNLMVDSGFFPLFGIAGLNASSNTTLTYVGPETRNNTPVIHISASQQFRKFSADIAALMQHLSQVDIYLDPTTLLPVFYVYQSHPDNDAGLDIPTEIHYSNYQSIGGVQTPLRIQKSMNGSLVLDLQFQNASLNTGLTATQITTQ